MVTAWMPFGVRRARFRTGPLRVLGLAALLLGLLYAHGLSPETTTGHLATSATASVVGEGGRGPTGEISPVDCAAFLLPLEAGPHQDRDRDQIEAPGQIEEQGRFQGPGQQQNRIGDHKRSEHSGGRGHHAAHPAQSCMSGQPEQGHDLKEPQHAPLAWDLTPRTDVPGNAARSTGDAAAAPPSPSSDASVLRL
jgi:hypothetical protein